MEEKKLCRTTERTLAGVCGGLAEYFGVDPVLVKIIFVVLSLAGGPGIILYIILWLVMPECDSAAPA